MLAYIYIYIYIYIYHTWILWVYTVHRHSPAPAAPSRRVRGQRWHFVHHLDLLKTRWWGMGQLWKNIGKQKMGKLGESILLNPIHHHFSLYLNANLGVCLRQTLKIIFFWWDGENGDKSNVKKNDWIRDSSTSSARMDCKLMLKSRKMLIVSTRTHEWIGDPQCDFFTKGTRVKPLAMVQKNKTH